VDLDVNRWYVEDLTTGILEDAKERAISGDESFDSASWRYKNPSMRLCSLRLIAAALLRDAAQSAEEAFPIMHQHYAVIPYLIPIL